MYDVVASSVAAINRYSNSEPGIVYSSSIHDDDILQYLLGGRLTRVLASSGTIGETYNIHLSNDIFGVFYYQFGLRSLLRLLLLRLPMI